MSVIEWQTYTIQPEARKELRICFHEKVLEELVEEEVILLLPQSLEHRSSVLEFVSWIPGTIVVSMAPFKCVALLA